ncbi:Gag-Pol polyprotein [Gossypium australe]|uniref:Gag-Pol polyprotein n=1 Tax=Gossypium australe TaxID=47621 RepID=A0A5B6VA33_9ROSI|nr:Gag-Pol polyprotein [Gossypium australe]
MTVTEYEREFVRLSKYARDYVSTEVIMCKRFVNGLNEEIKLLVGILDLKEFVVFVDRAYKAKEFSQEKKKADSEARDSRKRPMNKPYHSSSKKSRDSYSRSNADRGNQHVSPKAQATPVSSVGSVKNNKPECQQCRRKHFGDCWNKSSKACFKCGSPDHFIRDCLELSDKDKFQNTRPGNTTARGRPPRNVGNVSSEKGVTKDSVVRSDARAPARAYAIRAREEAVSPDVITGTFSLYYANNNEIIWIEPDESGGLPIVISSMSAQRYVIKG